MKQTREQNKRLILSDLLYAYRHTAEFKGYVQTFNDTVFQESHKGQLDTSLQAMKSAIELIIEEF